MRRAAAAAGEISTRSSEKNLPESRLLLLLQITATCLLINLLQLLPSLTSILPCSMNFQIQWFDVETTSVTGLLHSWDKTFIHKFAFSKGELAERGSCWHQRNTNVGVSAPFPLLCKCFFQWQPLLAERKWKIKCNNFEFFFLSYPRWRAAFSYEHQRWWFRVPLGPGLWASGMSGGQSGSSSNVAC